MKFFICGGSGFVGQALARRLEQERHEYRIYDKRLPGIGPGICADIQDVELLTQYMRGSDIVVHLASNADIAKSATEPTLDFIEGTQLTQKVLEAMRLSGVRRLVYFSGSGVYGEDRMANFDEDHGPLEPISPYGASKLASEAMISAYSHMFGIEAVIFRPANIVGPGQTHGVGFDFVRRLKENPARLRILGNGTQTKSYIHIGDVLDAVMLTIKNWYAPYRVFNVASEDYISVELIAMLVADRMGLKPEFEFTGGDRGWNGDVPIVRFDCSRLRALGWRPTRTSAQAVTMATAAML
jgi:UDP-glucose 4-epimerase